MVGHALLVLVRRSAQHDSSFEHLEAQCKQLDKYYVITRYPNGLPGLTPSDYFDKSEADESLKAAGVILLRVDQAIARVISPSEAHEDESAELQDEDDDQTEEHEDRVPKTN